MVKQDDASSFLLRLWLSIREKATLVRKKKMPVLETEHTGFPQIPPRADVMELQEGGKCSA